MSPAVFKALIILAYLTAYGHTPTTQAEIDSWAAKVQADGSNLDQVVAQIVNTPEGQAHSAQIRAVLDLLRAQAASQRELAGAFPA